MIGWSNLLRAMAVACVLLVAGAATAATPVTILYHPRSVVELRGQAEVEPFGYRPENPKHKDNQIPNTAIGNIYLNQPIGEFIADGVRQELRTSGVSLEPGGHCRIAGEVKAIKIADLGFDAHFSLSVHYRLLASDGQPLFETDEDTLFMASKFGGVEVSVSLMFSKNINAMIGAAEFMKVFEASCPKGSA